MALRERSISLPIVMASVAVALSIALLVGWTLVLSRYIDMTKGRSGGIPIMVLGIISFVIIMTVMVFIAVFLVREILDSRKQYRFMDSVTHELKSPLASMRLSAQTMANPRVNEEQRERLRRMILADVDRLTSVIDDILVASRLDSSAGRSTRSSVALSSLIDDTIEMVARRYQTHEDTLENLVPESLIFYGDRAGTAIVLSNLVDNAMKYSDTPRTLRIEAFRRENGGVNLCVSDRGIGISAAEIRRVRRRFYRSPNEDVRQRHGTGLGLYVVHGVAKRLGVALHIASEGEGKGTTIVLGFPKRRLRGIPDDLSQWNPCDS